MSISRLFAWGFAVFLSAAQAAPPSNPLDPSLPLTTHARVECLLFDAVVATGDAQAQCFEGSITATRAGSTGVASANLHTGELRATAISQTQSRSSGLLPGFGWAEAELYDTLTVVGPVTSAFRVNLSMTVGGFYSASSVDPWPVDTFVTASLVTLSVDNGFLEDSAGIRIELQSTQVPGEPVTAFRDSEFGDVTTNGVVPPGNPTSLMFDPSDMRFTLTSSFDITPLKPSFAFSARLLVGNFSSFLADSSSTRDTVLDFGQTARLSISAPPGVTFISESGAFLQPVPEPSTVALLTIGLAMLMAAAARQRAVGKRRSCLEHP